MKCFAVAAGAVGHRRLIGAVENVGPHRAGKRRQQRALGRVRRPSASGKLAAFEEARGATVEPVEEVLVEPLEVEQQRDRLAHPHIGEHRAAGVEHERQHRLRQAARKRFLDHSSVAHGGKVVSGLPAPGVGLVAQVVEAFLERLEVAVGVAKEVEAQLVEIPEAAVDREILAPIGGIAPQRHAPPGIDRGHPVGAAGERRRERGLLEMRGIDGVARQYRHQSEDERQLAVAVRGDVEAHGAIAERGRARHLGVVDAIVRPAVVAQQFPGEDDVVGGDRRAVGERRPGVELEGDVGALVVCVDRARQQAVERERLVIAAHQQALVDRAAQLRRRQSLHDERVEAVEGAEHAAHQAPALGGVGIDVAEGGKIRRQRRLAVHRDGVARLRRGSGHRRSGNRGSSTHRCDEKASA